MRQVDERKDFVLTRGGLADALSRRIRKKCVVTTNCEKSAEAIVPRKKLGKGRTIVSPYETDEGGQHYESRISKQLELPAEG